MLRAVILTQYRRVTDGQTDGIAVASTALAKRRAVKSESAAWFKKMSVLSLPYRESEVHNNKHFSELAPTAYLALTEKILLPPCYA